MQTRLPKITGNTGVRTGAYFYLSKFSTIILSNFTDSIKSDGLNSVILYFAKFIIWLLSMTGVASSKA